MRTCPCGNEVTTTRGRPRCDICRSPNTLGVTRRYVPPKHGKALVVRMPVELYEKVKACAAAEGMTISDYVRAALRAYVS